MNVMHSCKIHPSHPGSMREQRHELSPQRDQNPPSGLFFFSQITQQEVKQIKEHKNEQHASEKHPRLQVQ